MMVPAQPMMAAPMANPMVAQPAAVMAQPVAGGYNQYAQMWFQAQPVSFQQVFMQVQPAQIVAQQRAFADALIMNSSGFLIKQTLNMWEAISQGCCEQPNTYLVYASPASMMGNDQMWAAQYTKPILALKEVSDDCTRCCCAPNHGVLIYFHLVDQAGNVMPANSPYAQPVYIMKRDGLCSKCTCCCNCGEMCRDSMTLFQNTANGPLPPEHDAAEVLVMGMPVVGGGIEQACCCNGGPCIPTVHLHDAQKQFFATTEGPCFFGGCSENCCTSTFDITALSGPLETTKFGCCGIRGDAPDANKWARIVKKSGASMGLKGLATSACTDSDVYTLEFTSPKVTAQQRMIMLADLVLLDYMLFERDNGQCDCENNTLRITCCLMYCYGTLIPCNIYLKASKE